MAEQVTQALLKGFLEAFNRHDLDSIMDYFADDCVFYMPRGAKPRGDRYIGKDQVRAGLTKRFEGIPDVHYGEDQHWVCGNFGVSEWTLTGTSASGQPIQVRGVDLLEFTQGKDTVQKRQPYNHAWKYIPGQYLRVREYSRQAILAITHTVRPELYYDVRLSYLNESYYSGIDKDTSQYLPIGSWEWLETEGNGFEFWKKADPVEMTENSNEVLDFKGDLLWQIGGRNEVKFGLQAKKYDLRYFNVYDPKRNYPYITNFTKSPLEMAAYIQDKIEMYSFVLNLGLRFDWMNQRIPIFLFASALVSQGLDSINRINEWIKAGNLDKITEDARFLAYSEWIQERFHFLQLEKIDIANNILDLSTKLGQFLLSKGATILGNLATLVPHFFVMVFVVFYLVRDGHDMLERARYFSPLRKDQEDRLLNGVRVVARSVLLGTFLTALSQGLVGGIGLTIVGIPGIFWGTIMGFASLIPLIGTSLVWVPVAVYLAVHIVLLDVPLASPGPVKRHLQDTDAFAAGIGGPSDGRETGPPAVVRKPTRICLEIDNDLRRHRHAQREDPDDDE